MALDACNRYRLTSPLRPRCRHRHSRHHRRRQLPPPSLPRHNSLSFSFNQFQSSLSLSSFNIFLMSLRCILCLRTFPSDPPNAFLRSIQKFCKDSLLSVALRLSFPFPLGLALPFTTIPISVSFRFPHVEIVALTLLQTTATLSLSLCVSSFPSLVASRRFPRATREPLFISTLLPTWGLRLSRECSISLSLSLCVPSSILPRVVAPMSPVFPPRSSEPLFRFRTPLAPRVCRLAGSSDFFPKRTLLLCVYVCVRTPLSLATQGNTRRGREGERRRRSSAFPRGGKGGKRRDGGKGKADKGSVLQSEASKIFYELNCAGGLCTACRNRCPKIRRRTSFGVTDGSNLLLWLSLLASLV